MAEDTLKAAALCRQFEGLYLKPYLCPAGVPTIGFGSTFYEDGRRVKLTDPAITRERAEQLLLWELRNCRAHAIRLCPMLLLWGDDATAALIDFTFNLGPGNLSASTLRRRIAADDWVGARAEIMKWVKAGGVTLRGLVRRREAERELLPI